MKSIQISATWAWPVLLVSAVLEAVWANALSASAGFSRPAPTAIFVVATIASMFGLALAMRHIPTGTAYAVWTSVGTLLTVGYSVLTGSESISWAKALFLAGIVGCVIGLKRLDSSAASKAEPIASPDSGLSAESPDR